MRRPSPTPSYVIAWLTRREPKAPPPKEPIVGYMPADERVVERWPKDIGQAKKFNTLPDTQIALEAIARNPEHMRILGVVPSAIAEAEARAHDRNGTHTRQRPKPKPTPSAQSGEGGGDE